MNLAEGMALAINASGTHAVVVVLPPANEGLWPGAGMPVGLGASASAED